jgi:hypothetical protein
MRLAAFTLVMAFALGASAATPLMVDAARLQVGDVVRNAPVSAATVDLGPAPPPGGSRLLGRDEILDALKKAGVESARLRIPASVRVTGASRVVEPDQVSVMARALIQKDLPKGVTLLRVDAGSRVVISPRSILRSVKLAPLPRKKGPARVSAGLEWSCDERVVATGGVAVSVDISAEAAMADVTRGSALVLVVERNQVKVSAPGVSLADGMIGEIIRASVRSTNRVVSARIVARDRAVVIEQP